MRPENLRVEHVARIMRLSMPGLIALADNPRIGFHRPKMQPVGAKMRLITAPRRKWKMSYQWLGVFLRREFPRHSSAHGSVPGRSPFTAAARHVGLRNLLCRDVKNAFPSVTADRFYLEMLALGFQSDVARLLTKVLLPDGYLPQGGPASNAALDLFFYRTDCRIESELAALATRYTRFTDGLDASFRHAGRMEAVATVIERNISRLGLTINLGKAEKNGWQPVGTERVMCGVRVNSPRGTQLPEATLRRIASECQSLIRGAQSVAAHTLSGLAQRRRKLQGWINQASQADVSPTREWQRHLKLADHMVLGALARVRVFPNREWYIKGREFDEATRLALTWRRRAAAQSLQLNAGMTCCSA